MRAVFWLTIFWARLLAWTGKQDAAEKLMQEVRQPGEDRLIANRPGMWTQHIKSLPLTSSTEVSRRAAVRFQGSTNCQASVLA